MENARDGKCDLNNAKSVQYKTEREEKKSPLIQFHI